MDTFPVSMIYKEEGKLRSFLREFSREEDTAYSYPGLSTKLGLATGKEARRTNSRRTIG